MIRLGQDVKIHDTARINVDHGHIGDRSVIGANVIIEGKSIEIGNEAWLDEYAHIGGGSCFDGSSHLKVGDFLHMGRFSHLNPARRIEIGDEFGCGIGTKVFTHGAYESAWEGFPVQWGPVRIGDRVWLPNAWVNPGITIGCNVVVAAMSLVNRDLPSGCLAGGIPCRVISKDVYPRRLTTEEKTAIFDRIYNETLSILSEEAPKPSGSPSYSQLDENVYVVNDVVFDLGARRIEGRATEFSEVLRNQLRRNGIRFKYCPRNGVYEKW